METTAQPISVQSAATAENRYVTIHGDKIAYRSIGTGSPIILANRMRGTLDTWDPLFLDSLAREHNVIIFDYPGVGYSSGKLPEQMSAVAKFITDFAAALKLKSFVMAGWSWGGYAAQTVLLEYPQYVTHTILIGINPPGKSDIQIQQKWLDRALKTINDLDDEVILFFEPDSPASIKAAGASHDRIYARPDVVSKIPSTMEAFQAYLKAHSEYREDKVDRRGRLMQSEVPMLIICGDNDISVPVENWYPLTGKIPAAQLLVLPKSGHGPQHQYPELCAGYIRDFIRYM